MYRTGNLLARLGGVRLGGVRPCRAWPCGALALALPLALSIGGAARAETSVGPHPAYANVPSPALDPANAESVVRDLLVESGIELSLEQFVAATLEAGVAGAKRGAGDAVDADARVALITDALADAFAMTRMRRVVTRNVAAAIAPGDADVMLRHYRSDLGQRLRNAARTRRPADDPAGYARFVEALGSHPGDAERLALLERYVRDSDVAELVARFLVENRITSLHAVQALSAEAVRPRFEREVSATVDGLDRIRSMLAERLPPMLAYTYGEFSVDELGTMVSIELSEAGRRVTSGAFDGFREVAVAGNAGFVARIRAATSLTGLDVEI